MSAGGLEIRLHEGLERAEATRVSRALNEVVLSLREIDKVHLLRGTRATWVMADMTRRDRHLILRLEPRQADAGGREHSDLAVAPEALVQGASLLATQPVVPKLFTPKTVTRLGALAKPRDGVQSITLATYNGSQGPPALLSDPVRENAAAAVRTFEEAYGSVTGTLSGVRDARGKSVRVTVRDSWGKQAIDGIVPEAMAEELRSAWRHRVCLSGLIRRNARGQAIRVEVNRLELLPDDDSGRPLTHQLLGVGSDWLLPLTVDEFIQEVRDA